MANDGMKVQVSKDEFISLDVKEQNWLLFGGIENINKSGCSWAQEHYKKERFSKIQIWGAAVGGGMGFAVLAGKALGFF